MQLTEDRKLSVKVKKVRFDIGEASVDENLKTEQRNREDKTIIKRLKKMEI